MAVRKLLRPIFKVIHPDLTPTLPVEAKSINHKALMRLNAYIDILESTTPSQAPFVREKLTFFRPFTSRHGTPLAKASQLVVNLPSIPPMVDQDYKDYIAAELIRDVESALEAPCGMISDQPDMDVPRLFETESAKDNFNKVWWEDTHDAMFKAALYEDVEETRRRVAMKVFKERYEIQLTRKAQKLKNKTHRKRQLALVVERAQRQVDLKFERPTPTPLMVEEQELKEAKTIIIENGLHPDLVFFQDLTPTEKTEAVKRIT